MRVVAAPNALKGSLSAPLAARAIARGVKRALPHAEVLELPIADGGDGTAAVLCAARSGQLREAFTHDALGRELKSSWAALGEGTAAIDVASASGLSLLREEERDALRATSFGTGELLRAALDAGYRRIIVGVGGSATIDGGAGLLSALGFSLETAEGAQVPPGGQGLLSLERITRQQVHPALAEAELLVACDVHTKLPRAAALYGPQKGATAEQVALLQEALAQYARVLARTFNVDVETLVHGGAAGGIAAALHAALGAKLTDGSDLILDELGFDAAVRGAGLVLTAEGRLDGQTLENKGPLRVAERAGRAGVPTVILAGSIATDTPRAALEQFAAAFPILNEPATLQQALAGAERGLDCTAEQVARLFAALRPARLPFEPGSWEKPGRG